MSARTKIKRTSKRPSNATRKPQSPKAGKRFADTRARELAAMSALVDKMLAEPNITPGVHLVVRYAMRTMRSARTRADYDWAWLFFGAISGTPPPSPGAYDTI